MDYQPSTICRNPGHYKINHLGYRNYFGYISNFEAASGDPILYDPNLKKRSTCKYYRTLSSIADAVNS